MEKKAYDFQSIEQKWQKIWEDKAVFKTEMDHKKPKYYVLDMFPYPSGAGLHVGHVTGYTGTDIIARFKRMQGFNVLHPMGWDSFGLPAEQYAIRTGTHPQETTKKNIETYRRQLKSLGFSYDWSRELATSNVDYYKWTQWIFTKLFEKGLAYEDFREVNFCPALGTVLANEEIEEGLSKEGGHPVVKRPLRQWVLKITAYADRLLEDLHDLDWPENLKRLQINWIGKSEGVKIHFREQRTLQTISVFTTRQDTLFGATFLVLAPEHHVIEQICSTEQKEKVEEYQKQAQHKSDLERQEHVKDKTGVFTGSYALNPVTNEPMPIWISDYVLMSYGTGAVMAVPGHDERDFEFTEKFSLPVKCVIDPEGSVSEKERSEILAGEKCFPGEGTIINSTNDKLSIDGLSVEEAKEKMSSFLINEKIAEKKIQYRLRDWLFSRQRYWGEPLPILSFEDGTKRVLDLDELPLCPPHIEDYNPKETGESPLAKEEKWVHIIDPKTGKKATRETNTMPQWAGSCWYYLRFIDPHNTEKAWDEEKEKYWMPVDLYVGGAEHAVLHLLYSRFWHKVLYDCGLVSTSEPFKKYRYQGLVNAQSYKIKGGGYVEEQDVEKIGNKYFQKETKQPLLSSIEKMSKSKLNGVSPDEIVQEFGADTLRLYEMFMAPFDKEKIWATEALAGCKRFLNRFFDLFTSDKVSEEESEEALRLGHRLLDGVTKDIEKLYFNTAIAKMMEFINDFSPLSIYPKSVLKIFCQVLSPFAPHITEEAWEMLGENDSLLYHPLPEVDGKYLIEDMITYVVQINGKTRQMFELPPGKQKEEIYELATQDKKVSKYLTKEVYKLIYIPNKLLNIVIK